VFARGNKEKLATAIFEDQTNRTEFSAVDVGTTTAQKLFTPNRYMGARDDRHLRIQNNSTDTSLNSLHIATYTIKMQDGFLSSTTTANTFIIPAGLYLDLSPKTTYYGIYDAGASSTGVHVQVDFHDPSGTDAAGN
jgi:hypothetical protein